MARGRPKRHPKLTQMLGNPSKRPLHRLLDVPQGQCVPPPHLDDVATGAFSHVVAAMPCGVFTSVDVYALSVFAAAWSVHVRATRELQSEGLMVVGSKGSEIANPLIGIINSQAKVLLQAAVRLGLDPAARMNLAAPDYAARSKFDGLLGLRRAPLDA